MYLDMGDTLALYKAGGEGDLYYITFCVSLTTPDIIQYCGDLVVIVVGFDSVVG